VSKDDFTDEAGQPDDTAAASISTSPGIAVYAQQTAEELAVGNRQGDTAGSDQDAVPRSDQGESSPASIPSMPPEQTPDKGDGQKGKKESGGQPMLGGIAGYGYDEARREGKNAVAAGWEGGPVGMVVAALGEAVKPGLGLKIVDTAFRAVVGTAMAGLSGPAAEGEAVTEATEEGLIGGKGKEAAKGEGAAEGEGAGKGKAETESPLLEKAVRQIGKQTTDSGEKKREGKPEKPEQQPATEKRRPASHSAGAELTGQLAFGPLASGISDAQALREMGSPDGMGLLHQIIGQFGLIREELASVPIGSLSR